MKSITLRGIDSTLQKKLEQIADRENASINKTILSLLKKAVGLDSVEYPVYTDLDDLAGTWTVDEAAEFNRKTADFSEIDTELWK